MYYSVCLKNLLYNLRMDIEALRDKTIVMLGKPRAFSEEEFASQLEVHNITVVQKPADSSRFVLEGRLLTPHERDLFNELYATGKYEFLEIESFEQALAESINEDVLLMSLTLSRNKERLMAFIKNRHISDRLFFKLLRMHNFAEEDFFENDANRDVTAALIERFYENIERNHNVQFATTGLIHLVAQTNNSKLLETIANLPPTQKHPKLQTLLATHPSTPMDVLKRYLLQNNAQVVEAMACNSKLDHTLAKEMMSQKHLAQLIAQHIDLDGEMFALLRPYAQELACNESLDETMQRALLMVEDEEVAKGLAGNSATTQEILDKLHASHAHLLPVIVTNPNVNNTLLETAKQDGNLHPYITQNPCASQELLQELYETGVHETLVHLAQNPATPVDILYQLQLDSRYERYVRTNEAFGKHIQTNNIGWL